MQFVINMPAASAEQGVARIVLASIGMLHVVQYRFALGISCAEADA